MGFHPKETTHADAPEPQHLRKLDRVRAGTAHAALVFDGDDCLGWCQSGVPDEVPRIKSRRESEKGLVALPDWRIACCYVGRGHRRQGVPAGFLFNGAPSTYEKAGFVKDREIGRHRWVMYKDVEPKVSA